MSLVESFHAAHKARLARMAPKPRPIEKPKPTPYPYDAGWENMWFFELILEKLFTISAPKIDEIQRAVIDYYGVSKVDFFSQRRTAPVVKARQIAMYLAKTMTTRSLPEIGRRFNGRDHTTVLHAVRKITFQVEIDPEIRDEVASIRKAIR